MSNASPFTCDIDEYADRICRKEYWDDFSSEWSWSSIDEKLIRLGGFVLAGGSLLRLLNRYAKAHDEMYRQRIQHCILFYVGILITDKPLDNRTPLCQRIKCLDKKELVQLLKEELKKDVRERLEMDSQGYITKYWEVSKEHLLDDKILDHIERNHWRTNPDEAFSSYLRKQERFWDASNAQSIW